MVKLDCGCLLLTGWFHEVTSFSPDPDHSDHSGHSDHSASAAAGGSRPQANGKPGHLDCAPDTMSPGTPCCCPQLLLPTLVFNLSTILLSTADPSDFLPTKHCMSSCHHQVHKLLLSPLPPMAAGMHAAVNYWYHPPDAPPNSSSRPTSFHKPYLSDYW
jgi:hypothetical protein